MTLDIAIEILELTVNHFRADNTPKVRDAIKLGIEALRWVKGNRLAGLIDKGELLPGETEN